MPTEFRSFYLARPLTGRMQRSLCNPHYLNVYMKLNACLDAHISETTHSTEKLRLDSESAVLKGSLNIDIDQHSFKLGGTLRMRTRILDSFSCL